VYNSLVFEGEWRSGSCGRKHYSAKRVVGLRGLVRLRSLLPGAGQLLDLSLWARPRAMDRSDARVLWNASYRRNSHALGDARIAAHLSLFVYALPAPPALVRAGCKALDDRSCNLVHRRGSSHLLGGHGYLRQLVYVNCAANGCCDVGAAEKATPKGGGSAAPTALVFYPQRAQPLRAGLRSGATTALEGNSVGSEKGGAKADSSLCSE
jgi:hypothetical protein